MRHSATNHATTPADTMPVGRSPRLAAIAHRPRLQALALFLAFLGFYLFTVSGHFYTVDEETLYLMTQSLVERQSLALSADDWGIVGDWGLTIAPGSTTAPVYAIFTPGQPLAAIPLYLLGKGVAAFFPPAAEGFVTRFFVSLLGSFATAATVALLYRFARHLGYGGGAALGLAATYGLATTAWPHSRTFLAEPLTAFCLLLAYYGIRRGVSERLKYGWLAVSGLAAVGAVVTKPHALIALAILGPYLLWLTAAPHRDAGQWQIAVRRPLLAVAAWGTGAGLLTVAYLLFNLAIYGTLLRTGYGDWPLALFNYPFLKGVYGLTISSGKGIVWFAPPIILALVALRPFWRRHPAETTVCAAIALAHLVFYSHLRFWHGDWAWGPRFLLIALPFATLPLAALLEGLRTRPWRLALVGVVIAAGVGVQLLGTSVNFAWHIIRTPDQEARWFAPADSPILAHAQLARARITLWRAQLTSTPDTMILSTGFANGEHANDAIFPRWTTGAGTITLHPATRDPLTVKLTFFDHRPPTLRTDQPSILLDRHTLPEHALTRHDFSGTGEGWTYSFVVPIKLTGTPRTSLTLASDVWNPSSVSADGRDETLGVYLNNVEVWQNGRALTISKDRAIAPMPTTMPARHWWFNDDRAADHDSHDAPAPQLLDWWGWYAASASFPDNLTRPWLLAYSLTTISIGLGGLLLGLYARPHSRQRRTLRRWRVRRPTPRPRHTTEQARNAP